MLSDEAQNLARTLLSAPGEECHAEIVGLAKAGDRKTDRLLIELLGHRDVSLRTWILDTLWEFGNLETARKGARIGIRAKN